MINGTPIAARPSLFGKRRESPPPSLPSDLRDATRATLMIRAGKLICQSGEYVCLIRDVSSSGVRLRLFHALPPASRYFLEATNGESFAMENKWCIDDQAGFQFVEPIDASAFIEESTDKPRRPLRLRLACHGQVISQGSRAPMVLRNISQGGAQIETSTWLALHQNVKLSVDGLPDCFAQVRWRNRYDHGLAFTHPYSLDELADHAATLQPFAAQPTPAATQLAGQLLAQAPAAGAQGN